MNSLYKLQTIHTISNSIHSKYMDHFNMASIIYQYYIPTPLMKDWKEFCIRHSIHDHTSNNEVNLINAIKYPNSEEHSEILRHVGVDNLILELSNESKEYLLPYLLQDYDFKMFRPSLIYSINDSEDDYIDHLQDEGGFIDGFDYTNDDTDDYLGDDFYNRVKLLKTLRTILVSITSNKYEDGLFLVLETLQQLPQFDFVDKEYYKRAVKKVKKIFQEEVDYHNLSVEVNIVDEFENDQHLRNILEQAEMI
jgi:hypothetical protein